MEPEFPDGESEGTPLTLQHLRAAGATTNVSHAGSAEGGALCKGVSGGYPLT